MSSQSYNRRSHHSKSNNRTRRAVSFTLEQLEVRRMMAAHIVGSTVSYSTIQAAVNAASAGSVITVDAGTYNEEVTVNKSLTIEGAKAGIDARSTARATGAETIVDGTSNSSGRTTSFYITASNVTIDGFTIQGETNESVSMGAGIVMAPSIAGTHILNNIIQNNVTGVYLSNDSSTDPAVFEHNVFTANNNPGENGGRGIYTDGSLTGGTLTNVIIDANTFTNNHGGTGTTTAEAAIAFEAQTPGSQTNISVTNNTFTSNGKAILCMCVTGLLFKGNSVTGQTDSAGTIRFEGGDNNITIENNNVYSNGGAAVAVDAKGVPYTDSGFVVESNNFVNNSTDWGDKLSVILQAQYYVGQFDATNNWWGSSTGPSGQGTGTGDAVWGDGYWRSGEQWYEAYNPDITFSGWATTAYSYSTPSIPASITAAASVSSSNTPQVAVNWAASTGNVTTYELERSTNGTYFSTIAVLSGSVTSYVDSAISSGVSYTYRVSAEDGTTASLYATTGTSANVPTTNLSTLSWASATTGYGTIQLNKSINGNTLTLNGTTYSTGIGTHAPSTIVYNLDGDYSTFVSDVGIDAEEDGVGNGYVDFQVIGDGKVLFDSGVLTNDQVDHIDISVAGVQQLELVANEGIANNNNYDHADWAGAMLLGTPVLPPVPTGFTATALSSTSVQLSWNPGSANTVDYYIYRSTGNNSFSGLVGGYGISGESTSFIDTTAQPGTTYQYEMIAVNPQGNTSAYSTVLTITTPSTASTTPTAVSSLTWASATTGYGTIQLNHSVNGNALTLDGTTYVSGIGTHAASTIVYNIDGLYNTFQSDVGIDQEEDVAGAGEVDFEVIGDGKVLFNSGVLTNDQVAHINISVVGVQQLELVATNGIANNINYDHSDWAGAVLLGAPAAPVTPSGVAAKSLSSASIGLTWTAGSANTASYTISRSTDGVNFTTIATGVSGSATSYTDNTGLSADAKYYYEITAVNSVGSSVSAIVNATTQPLETVTYVSNLTAVSATTDWGSVMINKSVLGNPITLDGVVYSEGISANALSEVTYNLDGEYTNFISTVGIDQEEDGKGSGYVDFEVIGDGVVLYDSGVLTNDQVGNVNINVTGVQSLELVATNGIANDIDFDHADWAGAELLS
jgi:nitrous oxidase accessory protein NosD